MPNDHRTPDLPAPRPITAGLTPAFALVGISMALISQVLA